MLAALTWPYPEARFDITESGKSLTHKFEGINRGEGVIRIVSLKPSCPARVSATTDRMVIKPGETVTVTVTMNREGRGSQQESVLVKTDDGQDVRLAMRRYFESFLLPLIEQAAEGCAFLVLSVALVSG